MSHVQTQFAGVHRRVWLAVVVVMSTACATPPTGGEPVLALPDMAGLEGYLIEGGAWTERHSVFVNREFDFSLALADEIAGAGIAAARRAEENRSIASKLSEMRPLNWAREARAALHSHGHASRAAAGNELLAWGFLFGQTSVRVQTAFDLGTQSVVPGLRLLIVVDAEARPVDGGLEAWTANSGEAVAQAITRAFSLLPEVLEKISPTEVPGEEAVCPISSTYRYSGRFLYRGTGWSAFALAGQPTTLIVCVEPPHPLLY